MVNLKVADQYIMINIYNEDKWRNYLKQSLHFIDAYRFLLDTYVLDFFTEELWSRLNPKWSEALASITPQQLSDLLNSKTFLSKDRSVLPLSLLSFRVTCFTYSLPRQPIVSPYSIQQYLHNHSKGMMHSSNCEDDDGTVTKVSEVSCGISKNMFNEVEEMDHKFNSSYMDVSWGDAAPEFGSGRQHHHLQHAFRRHLKPKKQHEVSRLALIASTVAKTANCSVVVDVGSGQGHLSRLLAYGYRTRVVCLDAEDNFINGAIKFDNQLEVSMKKTKYKNPAMSPLPPAPRHAVGLISSNNLHRDFTKVVASVWPEACLNTSDLQYELLGLHTCGDLAVNVLRLFTSLPSCHAIVSVACCYMKISTHDTNNEVVAGYPLSNYVYNLEGNELTYISRELACHAIDIYSEKLMDGADNLKVHCYRAALEEIIVKYHPTLRRAGLRSINNAHKMSFSQYAEAAVSRLDKVVLSSEDFTDPKTLHSLSRWMQVVVFYSLRLMMAPVVETVILLDRLLYLHEKRIESILVPVFDPKLSPRNHALIAVKPYNKL